MAYNILADVSIYGSLSTGGSIDLTGNELLNVVLQNLSTAPSDAEGKIYYDTVTHKVKVYNGTAWVNVGGTVSGVFGASVTEDASGNYTVEVTGARNLTDTAAVYYDTTNREFKSTILTQVDPASMLLDGALEIGTDLTVGGNLTVQGTVTYIESNTVQIGDAVIELNSDLAEAGTPTENAGFTVNRGASADVSFLWDETNDRFTTVSEKLYVGSTLEIGSIANKAVSQSDDLLVNNAGVVNKVQISSVLSTLIVAHDGGTTTPLNGTISFIGGDAQGIDVTSSAAGIIDITAKNATTAQKGVVELATDAEANTGTDTTRAVTASGVSANVASRISNAHSAHNYVADPIPAGGTINHDLDSQYLIVQCVDRNTMETVFFEVQRLDANNIKVIVPVGIGEADYMALMTKIDY